jgi:hypothetical protein
MLGEKKKTKCTQVPHLLHYCRKSITVLLSSFNDEMIVEHSLPVPWKEEEGERDATTTTDKKVNVS